MGVMRNSWKIFVGKPEDFNPLMYYGVHRT